MRRRTAGAIGVSSGAFAVPAILPKQKKPRINTVGVPCPTCGAVPKQECSTGDGAPASKSHVTRSRMATRKYNQERLA